MQQIAKALAAEDSIEWRGKTYKMAPMGMQKVKKDFQKWSETRALMNAIEVGKELTAAGMKPEADKLFSETRQDIGACLYAFGGSQFAKLIQTYEGQVQLIYLMIAVNHPEFTAEMANEMAIERLDEILAKLDAAAYDPNLKTPA